MLGFEKARRDKGNGEFLSPYDAVPMHYLVPVIFCRNGDRHEDCRSPKVVTDRTCGYDVSTTIMKNALGVVNSEADFGIGSDLLNSNRAFPDRNWFRVGTYNCSAVIEKKARRIIRVSDKGSLKIYTGNYEPHQDRSESWALHEAVRLTMRDTQKKGHHGQNSEPVP